MNGSTSPPKRAGILGGLSADNAEITPKDRRMKIGFGQIGMKMSENEHLGNFFE